MLCCWFAPKRKVSQLHPLVKQECPYCKLVTSQNWVEDAMSEHEIAWIKFWGESEWKFVMVLS